RWSAGTSPTGSREWRTRCEPFRCRCASPVAGGWRGGMSAATIPALLACGLFGAGMLHAAVTDLRHRRIRNWLVAALAAAWAPMAIVVGVPGDQMVASALAAALVFFAGFGCFSAGWLGGGDVKLAAVAVLWLGAGQAITFLLLAAVLGAGLA